MRTLCDLLPIRDGEQYPWLCPQKYRCTWACDGEHMNRRVIVS
jgi:hypothetical protein